jgi:transglutaminase-like putative cysteine protease
VLSWQLDLPRPVRAQLDPFGNILHVLTMDEPHEAIIIGARGQVDIDELREAEHESQSALPFLRFTRLTEADAALRAFAENLQAAPRSHGADRLMHGLNQHMTYTPGATEVDTSAAQAFAGRAGVCQDHTMRSSPVPAAWGFRRGMSRVICTAKTASTWPAMPGPKPGWMTPGTALT